MSLTNEQIKDVIQEKLSKDHPQERWIVNNLLFLHKAGSHLYGVASEKSDLDVRGVCFSPKSYYSGAKTFEQIEMKVPELDLDIVIYDVRKWIRLTRQGNPNVLETLYVDPKDNSSIQSSEYFQKVIRPETKKLMTTIVFEGFKGYSHAQLKKMRTKLANNTGRQEIVEAYGFDTKFASHGFRLVRQGSELLRTGHITFPRPDAQDLRDIKFGFKYKQKELAKCVADWEKEENDMKNALAESRLPKQVDFNLYENLLNRILDDLVLKS